jgi:iron complex outermembrane receptor protein
MDASVLGQDHGVPIDPLAIQKVEILRGPDALRYGMQATGGIVDATNNRIPDAAPRGGWAAQILGATTTGDRGVEGGVLLDAGTRNFAIHADAYGRHSNDYFVPSYPYLFPPDPAPPFNGKQPNSGLHSEGHAIGGSYLFDGGYIGAAYSRFTSVYRIPTLDGAATNTRIDMQQDKFTSKGEFRPQSSAIDVIRFWAGAVEYHHDELGFDDAGIDTSRATFKNHAQEAKAEIKFMPMTTPLGAMIASFGTQFEHSQIDTAGDAGSLLNSARTNREAAYFFNELWLTNSLRTLLAGRIESVRLDGTAGIFPPALVPPPDAPQLLPSTLGFVPKSISFSVLKDLPWFLVASATLQRIQRAPTVLELFAHGAHDAPGTFEIGDPNLKIETANTAEIGLKRAQGSFRFDAKTFYTRYDNFIFRQFTGISCGADFATCGVGTEFLQTIYAQRDAIFRGGEVAWQLDLMPLSTGIFGIDGQYDFVRATFTDGSNVPRIPPMRVGGGAYWRNDNWFVRMGLIHAFGQGDLALNETPTAGYNLLKMEISQKQYYKDSPWGPTEVTTGLVGDNLLDVDIRNHVQFHKDEILWPGRSIKLFFNAKFGAPPPVGKDGSLLSDPRFAGWPAKYSAPLITKAPVVMPWTWAGPYLGVNVGYAAGRSKTDGSFNDTGTGTQLFATSSSDRLNSTIGGIQAGYNWQWGNWVAGVEADFQLANQHSSPQHSCPGAICNPALGAVGIDAPATALFDQGHRLGSFGTLRARLGTTVTPDIMAYATGGLAVASIKTSGVVNGSSLAVTPVVDADGNPVLDDTGNPVTTAGAAGAGTLFDKVTLKAGWTAGAGVEARLTGNWTGKVEYLYMDFGTISTTVSNPFNSTPINFSSTSRITDHIIRVGLNYKYDPLSAPTFTKGPIATAWSWAGFYVGLNIGYGSGRSKTDGVFSDPTMGSALFATNSADKLSGTIGGVQIGYNWQSGNWVAGVEADVQLSRQSAGPKYACASAICNPAIAALGLDAPVTAQLDQGHKLDSFATLRARLGAAVTPDIMPYVTGGLAVASIRTSGVLNGSSLTATPVLDDGGNPVLDDLGNPVTTSSVSAASKPFTVLTTKAGFTVGAGIEGRLAGNLTGKVEYLYMDLGTVSGTVTNPLNSTPVAFTSSSRITDHIVRVGINYKLDPSLGIDEPPAGFAPLVYKGRVFSQTPPVMPWTWAGPYLGFNIGYGRGKSNTDTVFSDTVAGTPLLATNNSHKLDGLIFGGQIGYNWLAGNWLFGIETDLQRADQRASRNLACAGAICNPAADAFGLDAPVNGTFEQRLEAFATLRGRLGAVVTPGAIAYVTGGLAVGKITTSGNIGGSSLAVTPVVDADGNPVLDDAGNPIVAAGLSAVGSSFINQTIKAGWTLGTGIEARLGDSNLTGKIEYLYMDLGRVSANAVNPLNAMPLAVAFNSRITNNIVRVGINYKFDPIGAGYDVTSKEPMIFKASARIAWSWAGPYLGFNVGYGTGKSNTDSVFSDAATTTPLYATNTSAKLDGVLFGAQAGYNWQAGALVAGIEGDLQLSGQRADPGSVCPGAICNPGLVGVIADPSVLASFEQGQKLEWFGTLRGRLGAAVTPGALAYVTGGLTVGEVMTSGTVLGFDGAGNPINSIISQHKTKAGWTAGVGIEAQLIGNWTGKLEYLYLDLGSVAAGPTVAPNVNATVATTFSSRVTDNIVRAGINYKFD